MLVRYNPRRSLVRRAPLWPSLWDDEFFGLTNLWKGPDNLNMEEPKITFKEHKKNYLLRAEFPGFDKDEIKAEVVDGVLTLRAEHNDEKWDQDEDEGWRSIETRKGAYTSSFRLPEDVVPDKIKAEMKKGVLRMTLPRKAEEKEPAKQIPVH